MHMRLQGLLSVQAAIHHEVDNVRGCQEFSHQYNFFGILLYFKDVLASGSGCAKSHVHLHFELYEGNCGFIFLTEYLPNCSMKPSSTLTIPRFINVLILAGVKLPHLIFKVSLVNLALL